MSLLNFKFNGEQLKQYSCKAINFTQIKENYPDKYFLQYVEYLEKNLKFILIDHFNELKVHKDNLQKIIDFSRKCALHKLPDQNCLQCKNDSFCKEIQKLFNYDPQKIRKYFNNIQNKACYICNAQYTIFAYECTKVNDEIRLKTSSQKFQFDHYFPQSIYPAFSLSLGNLIPICGSCNLKKLEKVYNLENINEKISYKIDEDSLFKYLQNNELLKFKIKDKTDDNISVKFDFEGIYSNHRDHLEELLERKIKYTDNYKKVLENRFSDIVISEKNIEDRLILGTYTDDIYKRPLSKFINDINNQLDNL